MFYKQGKKTCKGLALLLSAFVGVASAAPDLHWLQQQGQAMQENANQLQRARSDIVVLVSFSMPEASLKRWVADASRVGAVIELRGLTNQSFQETTQKILALSNHQGAAWRINPKDFEQYQVTTVPAVIVFNPQLPMQFDSVQGDGTLEAALSRIAEEGQEQEHAKDMLSLLHEDVA